MSKINAVEYISDSDESFLYQYSNQFEQFQNLYHHEPFNKGTVKARHTYARNDRSEALAKVIHNYMTPYGLSTQQIDHLRYLREGHQVVIGGQQAGLFMGPMYTLHKVLSIIIYAKEQTELLKEKVVPVFWIAGEDHDLNEVNHGYALDRTHNRLKKTTLDINDVTTSVHHYKVDKNKMKEWVQSFFLHERETKHTKELHKYLLNIIDRSEHFVDLFSHMIQTLFKSEGLLFIDSHDSRLRELEKPFLHRWINEQKALHLAYKEGQTNALKVFDQLTISVSHNTHLFYEYKGVRASLNFDGERFQIGETDVYLTENELHEEIDRAPHLFSNNVVSRPLMQEWLFNTLAFIGGPSEIKYWAELTTIFKFFDMEMPIIVPRLRITYLTAEVSELMERHNITFKDIDSNMLSHFENKINDESEALYKDHFERLNQCLMDQLDVIQQSVTDSPSKEYLMQSEHRLQKEIKYIERKLNYLNKRTYRNTLNDLKWIQLNMHPKDGLQERVFHPLHFLNEYGLDWFSSTTYPPLSYTNHKIIVKTL